MVVVDGADRRRRRRGKLAGVVPVVRRDNGSDCTGIRRGRWSGADADSAAVLLRRLPVRRVAEDHAHAFELARRYENWPVYDMVYVAVAERAGTEFVTADAKLRARLAHLGWVKLPAEATVGG